MEGTLDEKAPCYREDTVVTAHQGLAGCQFHQARLQAGKRCRQRDDRSAAALVDAAQSPCQLDELPEREDARTAGFEGLTDRGMGVGVLQAMDDRAGDILNPHGLEQRTAGCQRNDGKYFLQA